MGGGGEVGEYQKKAKIYNRYEADCLTTTQCVVIYVCVFYVNKDF